MSPKTPAASMAFSAAWNNTLGHRTEPQRVIVDGTKVEISCPTVRSLDDNGPQRHLVQ